MIDTTAIACAEENIHEEAIALLGRQCMVWSKQLSDIDRMDAPRGKLLRKRLAAVRKSLQTLQEAS